MAERGWGRVVTIGSVQQERPHPAMFVYAGTKAAQLNWALNLARQFGGQGVTVNNLAPGAILTARNRDQMAVEGEASGATHSRRPAWPAGRSGRRGDAAVLRRRPLHQRGQSLRRWRTHRGVISIDQASVCAVPMTFKARIVAEIIATSSRQPNHRGAGPFSGQIASCSVR